MIAGDLPPLLVRLATVARHSAGSRFPRIRCGGTAVSSDDAANHLRVADCTPLSVVGSQLAHELAYRLVVLDSGVRAHELAATGHAYLAYLPLALAVCTALVGFALLKEARAAFARSRGSGYRPSARSFALLAPVIFICQEHFERLAHDGSFAGTPRSSPASWSGWRCSCRLRWRRTR